MGDELIKRDAAFHLFSSLGGVHHTDFRQLFILIIFISLRIIKIDFDNETLSISSVQFQYSVDLTLDLVTMAATGNQFAYLLMFVKVQRMSAGPG